MSYGGANESTPRPALYNAPALCSAPACDSLFTMESMAGETMIDFECVKLESDRLRHEILYSWVSSCHDQMRDRIALLVAS